MFGLRKGKMAISLINYFSPTDMDETGVRVLYSKLVGVYKWLKPIGLRKLSLIIIMKYEY